MAIVPPAICTPRLLHAINLKDFVLYSNALGTMFADAKNKFMDSNWVIATMLGCL